MDIDKNSKEPGESNTKEKSAVFYYKKKAILIGFLITVIFIVFIVILDEWPNKKNQTDTTGPTSSPLVVGNTNEKEFDSLKRSGGEIFLLNRFDSLIGVVGYGWNENKIIYATDDGVYMLWKNQQILKENILDITFDNNGGFTYSNNSNTYYYSPGGELVELNINPKNTMKISDNGDHILFDDQEGVLSILKIDDKSIKKTDSVVDENNTTKWIDYSNYFLIHDRKKSLISVYDTNIQKINQYKIEKGDVFLGISPDLEFLVTKKEDNMFVSNQKTGETVIYKFTNSKELRIKWVDEKKFYVNQEVPRGIYDLYDQFFWFIDISAKNKKLLTNSMPIQKKINSEIDIKLNKDKTAILFSENEGKIWLISLIPNKIGVYRENGIYFYKVDNLSEEDYH